MENNTLVEYVGTEAELTIPAELGITAIGAEAFKDNTSLVSVVIPEGVVSVEDSAFSGCGALESVAFPETLQNIGSFAFRNCSALESISLPGTIYNIGSYAFAGCEKLKSFDMPEALSDIGSYAFSNCTALSEINLNPALVSIRENAFAGCTALARVDLHDGVQTVEKGTFPHQARIYCNPSSAAAFSISANGGSFVSPENEMFGIRLLIDGDLSLGLSVEQIWTDETEVQIPEYIGGETVTEIGASVFASCPSVTTVTLPASVPVIPAGMLNVGLGKQLENVDQLFVIKPENIPYEAQLSFYAEDEEIAVVENGVLTGLSVGETNLVGCLTENNEILAKIKIYVRENVTDFVLPDEIWQPLHETLTLVPVSTTPEGANDGYKWTLEHNLGIIDDGYLRIYRNDNSFDMYVKMTAANGFSVVENIRVYRTFDSIDIADCFVVPLVQDRYVYIDAYTPEHYGSPYLYNYSGEADVLFSAEDTDVVYVNDRCSGEYVRISGQKVGETILTAKGRNGVTDTARVVVYDTVEGVSMDPVGPQRIYDNVQMNADVVLNGMTVSSKYITDNLLS